MTNHSPAAANTFVIAIFLGLALAFVPVQGNAQNPPPPPGPPPPSPTAVPAAVKIGLGQQPIGNAGEHLGALWGVEIPYDGAGVFRIPPTNTPPNPPAGADNEGAPGVADAAKKALEDDSNSKDKEGEVALGHLSFLYFLGVPPEAISKFGPGIGGGMTQIDPLQLDLSISKPIESVIPELDQMTPIFAAFGFSQADAEWARANARAKRIPENAKKAETDADFRNYLEELAEEGNLEAQDTLEQMKKNMDEIKSAARTKRTTDSILRRALDDPAYRDNIMKTATDEFKEDFKKAYAEEIRKRWAPNSGKPPGKDEEKKAGSKKK